MSQLLNARRQLAMVGSQIKQGNLFPAVTGLQAGLHATIQQQLLKNEREEMHQLISDAVMHIANDKTLRKIFPLALEYTPGEERELLETVTELLSMLRDESITNAQDYIDKNQPERNRELLAQGQAELDAKEHDKARITFSTLAAENPTDSEVHADIGSRFLQAGLLEDAVASFTSAANLDKNSAYAFNHLGIAYRRMKRYDLSAENFEKAMKISPEDPYIYFNLGRMYLDREMWKEASEFAQKASSLDPNFEEAKKLSSYAKKKMSA